MVGRRLETACLFWGTEMLKEKWNRWRTTLLPAAATAALIFVGVMVAPGESDAQAQTIEIHCRGAASMVSFFDAANYKGKELWAMSFRFKKGKIKTLKPGQCAPTKGKFLPSDGRHMILEGASAVRVGRPSLRKWAIRRLSTSHRPVGRLYRFLFDEQLKADPTYVLKNVNRHNKLMKFMAYKGDITMSKNTRTGWIIKSIKR